MKSLILTTILVAVSAFSSFSETMLVSDGATNSILVVSNEAVIIDLEDPDSRIPILRRGTNSFRVDVLQGSAFMGPCELVYAPLSAAVTFRRLQTTMLKTVILASNETELITVPPGKTLRIFPSSLPGGVLVARDTNERRLSSNAVSRGCEFTGPLSVILTGYSSELLGHEYRQVFTYCLVDEFIQLASDGYLKGPIGSFEIVVEKSTDLTRWVPAMVQSTSTADTRAYYRLRIQK